MNKTGKNAARPWTEVEINRLVDLRQKGWTFSNIAKIINRNVSSTENKYYTVTETEPERNSWPPTKDTWTAPVCFRSENLPIKSGRTFVTRTDHGDVRSLVGTTLG